MEGTTVDHSDSDSGESWTLLENHPAYGEEAPDFSENSPTPFERGQTEARLEKDEDTDGISIISDSDPESAPCEISCEKCLSSSQPQDILHLNEPQPPNNKTIESICNENDFLGDNSQKLKTYVHRRNKRLSMVLNIIMLGSVITAAGVAIGHMWGAKNECAAPTPSVNKILSNLYKLQEENAYLRNRLKELTLLDKNEQVQQPQSEKQKKTEKQHRCKKIFEEPLNIKVDQAFKCLDESSDESVKILDTTELLSHEKEFLNDIGKLKKVYNHNKSWLDDHIQRRLNYENNIMRNKHNIKKKYSEANKNQEQKEVGPAFKLPKLEEHDESSHTTDNNFRIPESDKGTKPHKAWNLKRQISGTNKINNSKKNKKNEKRDIKLTGTTKSHKDINLEKQTSENLQDIASSNNINQHEDISNEASQSKEKKISYADSLKTGSDSQKVFSQINDSNELPLRGMRGYGHKRKHGDVDLLLNLISSSEDEIKKDDRYTGPKIKRDKKKHDRHKIHKKQKRKNKYEEWEMKGGYMKDFDEFSTSSQVNMGNDAVITPEKKYLNYDFENYVTKLPEAEQNKKSKNKNEEINKPENKGEKGKEGKSKDSEWYDKRYNLRAEARRKLEQELFGDSSPSNAAWYFRRMNKREQCRAQKDNSTFKKFSKQKMNFKIKH